MISTHWVGAQQQLGHPPVTAADWLRGARFALPLLAILVAHEAGHFFAAVRRGVRASLPMFIPVPIGVLGTMGAVIGLARVRRRDAMLEIGAAGPIAGLCVALPVLVYGVATSTVSELPSGSYLLEGRSLVYLAILRALHGPIPEGHDVMLEPEAFAGWAGLLVTMANLVPIGQLDGGHVMRALLGAKHARLERPMHIALGLVGAGVTAGFGISAALTGGGFDGSLAAASGGMGWLVWAGMIALIGRLAPPQIPRDTLAPRSRVDVRRLRRRRRRLGPAAAVYAARKAALRARLARTGLSGAHRGVAVGTLLCFPLLFMPFWLRVIEP